MDEPISAAQPLQRYVYLLLSRTPTKFGKVIRLFSGATYNHASLSFDERLHELYSFGRRQYRFPLNAGLIVEYPERFSLNKVDRVDVRLYKIPVTQEQYALGKALVSQIRNDEDYLYNLFSVLLYPILHGFHTYKSFSCAEFVVYLLQQMEVPMNQKRAPFQYLPDEIGSSLACPVVFEGNLLEYDTRRTEDTGSYFSRIRRLQATRLTVYIILRLIYRKLRHLREREDASTYSN